MKKILWVNASLSQGGSERVMSILASAFANRGIDTSMVLLREGKEDTYSVSPKLKVIHFHYNTKNKATILLKRFFQMRKLVRRERPDWIISFMWDINAFTLLSCLGLNRRIIVSERAHPLLGHQNVFRRLTQNRLYRLADKIVFQTKDVAQYYPEVVQRKATVIPNPINPHMIAPWKGERRKVIVSAGRLTEQKNFTMLVRSFAVFHQTHPLWSLAIFGEGPQKELLQDIISALRLDGKVILPGFVEDLPEKIKDAGMYVNSSNFEGISNVMLEALSLGVPSICTNCPVGGAELVINDGINGLLVPVGDEKALTEAMCRIADEAGLAEQFSKEAIRIRETFSVEKICDQWLQLCK